MNIKEFTKSAITLYLEKGGTVHPDITLDIFKLIESNEGLLNDYKALSAHSTVNPTVGKTIREFFDLRNDRDVLVTDQCKLIKSYKRFHKKS
jgi:hypothetical protein